MNERRDEIDLVTEERLRRAVRFRDAEVTPSPGALDRIRARAVGAARPSRARPGVLLAAAAVLVVVIGGLALAFRSSGDTPDLATDSAVDDADADLPDAPPADQPDTPTTSLLPATTTDEPAPTATYPSLPDMTAQERADEGLIVWPLDSRSFDGATSVAYSYATQALGIDDPVLETDCCEGGVGSVTIAQRAEDGSSFGEATRLDVVALDQFNWVVVKAESAEVDLTSVLVTREGLATVTGSGRSFEGAARLVARSTCDPEGVRTAVTVGGGPEFAEFVQEVAFVPCGDSPLVVELLTEKALADGVPFVSAVAYVPPAVEVTWSVMRVEADDVLNVRATPGVDGDIVATLAPGTTGIEMGAGSETVAGNVWREIVTPDGVTGWVNFAYLTAQPAVLDARTAATMADIALSLTESDPPTSDLNTRGVYVGGIGIYADAGTPFVEVPATAFSDASTFDWTPFPDSGCGSECSTTVADFLDFDGFEHARIELPIGVDVITPAFDNQFLIGPLDQLSLFEPLHVATIEVPGTDEIFIDWRRYHVWFDWADGAPKVIAIYRWGWTP